jgi:hypothetical protein
VLGHVESSRNWKGQIFLAAVYNTILPRAPGGFVDTYDTPETTIYTGINSSLFYSARSLGLKKNFAAGLPPLPV